MSRFLGNVLGINEAREEMRARVDLLLSVQREATESINGLRDAIRELAVSGQKIDPQFVVDLTRIYGEMKEVSREVTKALEKTLRELERVS